MSGRFHHVFQLPYLNEVKRMISIYDASMHRSNEEIMNKKNYLTMQCKLFSDAIQFRLNENHSASSIIASGSEK